MLKIVSKFIILFFTVLISANIINAQISDCSDIAENPRDPYPKQIKEKLIEMCIERAKKDFQELLDRGEEITKLTSELENSYTENNGFSNDDRDKLDRVENLLKKIRKDLRADDDDDDDDKKAEKPQTVLETLKTLKEKTFDFFEELKKTSRYSISAVAIQSSSSIMKIVRFLRIKN